MIGRFFRRFLGLDRSGQSLDAPRFEIKGSRVVWNCHVCHTSLKAPLFPNRKIETTCSECGAKRTITNGYLDPPRGLLSRKGKVVFVTRATLKELDAKQKAENGSEPDMHIRKRLVYHDNYGCAYAHRDYEVDGTLIAYNTGVVEAEYHRYLKLCKACAGVEFEPCDRCGGRGDIPEFRHVANGICFKCRGQGYFERYPEKAL